MTLLLMDINKVLVFFSYLITIINININFRKFYAIKTGGIKMNNINYNCISNLMTLPIPTNWKLFENMCQDVFSTRFGLDFQPYGRGGQNQYGIDLFATNTTGQIVVVQCKNFFSGISSKTIDTELGKFENIPLENIILREKYIFATTAFRDTTIQNYILNLNISRTKDNKCPVEIYFWEDIVAIILNNKDIFTNFYGYLTPSLTNPYMLIDLVFWYSSISNHCLLLLEDETISNTILGYLYNGRMYFSRNTNLLGTYTYCIDSLIHEIRNFDMNATNIESTPLFMCCRQIEDLIKELPNVLNEKELIYFQICNLLALFDFNASIDENFSINPFNKELFINYINKLTNNENIITYFKIKIDRFSNINYTGYKHIYFMLEDIKKYIPIF